MGANGEESWKKTCNHCLHLPSSIWQPQLCDKIHVVSAGSVEHIRTIAYYISRLIKAAADFGSGKIHLLINNAGYTWDGVIHKTTSEQWDAIITTHTKAPFILVREAAKYFRVTDERIDVS